MLTASDLSKIKNIVHGEIKTETPPIVEKIVTKHLTPIGKDVTKIRKDLEYAIGSLDKDRWILEQRVNTLESQYKPQ